MVKLFHVGAVEVNPVQRSFVMNTPQEVAVLAQAQAGELGHKVGAGL